MKLKKRADRCQRYREIQTVLREKTAGDVRYGKIDGIDRRSFGIPGLGGADTVRSDDYGEIEAMTALSGEHPRYIGRVLIERVLKQKL